MKVYAIDPGYEQSALVVYDGRTVINHETLPNAQLLEEIGAHQHIGDHVLVIEQIASFGMPVGAGLHSEELCLISYQRPVEGCPTYIEHFKEGDAVPSRLCSIHEGNLKQEVQRAVQGLFGAIGRGIRGIFR